MAAVRGWAVVLGDVCGKGAPAARTTALARSTVRAIAHVDPAPSRALRVLNEVLLQWFGADDGFVTAVYATLTSTSDGWRVCLVRAGHPAPVLRRADGTVRDCGPSGTVLGCLAEVTLVEEEFLLEPGDSLVLVTDGVLEARAPGGKLYEVERLHRLIGALPIRAHADHLARAIQFACRDFAQGAAHDDTAIVVLQATDV